MFIMILFFTQCNNVSYIFYLEVINAHYHVGGFHLLHAGVQLLDKIRFPFVCRYIDLNNSERVSYEHYIILTQFCPYGVS